MRKFRRSHAPEHSSGNLTLKVKFSLYKSSHSSGKIWFFLSNFCRFFKIISQFDFKSQIFSRSSGGIWQFLSNFRRAAPSNRTGAAPAQLQTAAPTRGAAAAPSQLPDAAPSRPTPTARGRGTRTFVRRMSDVRQSECPTSYVRQTYVRQRVSQT